MSDQDDPQIPLKLAAAMADLLMQNAAFQARMSDGYLWAVREHIWQVNTDIVMRELKEAWGPELNNQTIAHRIKQARKDTALGVPYRSCNRSRRSATYAMLFYRLTGVARTDPILHRLHSACRDVLTEWPDGAATPDAGRFLDTAMALSDWVNVHPLIKDFPALRPVTDLRLAMVLNDEDTRDILAPAIVLSHAMAQEDATDPASKITAATAELQAHIRAISPGALGAPMEDAISAQVRKGAPEICETLLQGALLARSEVGRLTGLSPRQQSRAIEKLFQTGWVTSDSPKGPLRLRIPCSCFRVIQIRVGTAL